jgi:hypothetical protein
VHQTVFTCGLSHLAFSMHSPVAVAALRSVQSVRLGHGSGPACTRNSQGSCKALRRAGGGPGHGSEHGVLPRIQRHADVKEWLGTLDTRTLADVEYATMRVPNAETATPQSLG